MWGRGWGALICAPAASSQDIPVFLLNGIRQSLGLSQTAFAERFGFSLAAVCDRATRRSAGCLFRIEQ